MKKATTKTKMEDREVKSKGHTVILFYKYADVENPSESKREQEALCQKLGLKGRILISEEGINATLSSPEKDAIEQYIDALCAHPTFAMKKDDFKHSFHAHEASPFCELIVKYVKEIVSTGGIVEKPNMNATDAERGYLTPEQFHQAMQAAISTQKNDTVVLDVRAHKEFLVGHFENAVDPEVKNFSEYYAFLQNRIDELKEKKVLMYCTGGIRCEKASNFLRSKGVEDVYHLKGGIHKYLEKYQDGGFFKGKNFVFDKRVLMGAQNAEVVGKCIECQAPYDEFSGRKVCSVCRDLVLVCDACYEKRHGEVHCTDHQYLKHCYTTFIQYLTREELTQQRDDLQKLADQYALEKGWKNKRRTIRKQLEKLQTRIDAIDSGKEVPSIPKEGETRPIHCRTCGLATCRGNCWGFWNDFPTEKQATAEQETPVAKKQRTDDNVE